MKIGILSDTHDNRTNIFKAIAIFRRENVKYIFHAGDIISPFAARAFSQVEGAKFIAVFGNNDGEKLLLEKTIKSFGGEIHDDCFRGQIEGKSIFMVHQCGGIDEIAGSGKFDIVICGHTHKRDIRKIGKTLFINPGESTDWLTENPGIVVLELETMKTEEFPL